jgi:hypothetical protein
MFSFFSHKFSNTLTQISNHYIDWSRIGSLVTSNHRYSLEELLTRSAIITATGVSAFLGYQYSNNTDENNYSSLTLTLAAGTLGFFVSHTIVIAPLIYKRYKINQQCQELIADMKTLDNAMKETNDKLRNTINSIMQLSLADEKRSNASLTWGHRRTLLKNLKENLEPEKSHSVRL